eukprot:3668638-Amphidinium_carterae.3
MGRSNAAFVTTSGRRRNPWAKACRVPARGSYGTLGRTGVLGSPKSLLPLPLWASHALVPLDQLLCPSQSVLGLAAAGSDVWPLGGQDARSAKVLELGFFTSFVPAKGTPGKPSGGLAVLQFDKQAAPLQRMEHGVNWDAGR